MDQKKNFLSVGNFILTFLLLVSVLIGLLSLRRIFTTSSQAANACNVTEGATCTLGGQWALNKISCSGSTPTYAVYFCDATAGMKWVFSHNEAGESADCPSGCVGATPQPTITPGGCNCSGGTFTVRFTVNRALVNGESITCSLTKNGNCGCGTACTGAVDGGSCSIGAGGTNCKIQNIDCSCKPFGYSCSGSVEKNGNLTASQVTNGAGTDVPLTLPSPPTETPPTTTPPTTTPPTTTPPTTTLTPPTATPTKTPTPTVTLTPPPGSSPTPTPTKTPTPTPTVTTAPSNTPTPTPTNTPAPTSTPVPTSTPYPTATPVPTATPAPVQPTYTPAPVPPTYTPYPTATPVVYAQQPTPVPRIPSAGFELSKMWPILVSVVLLGAGIIGVIL